MTATDIAKALKGRRSGAGWICSCPAHDDHHPSLSLVDRDGKVLVKCWSGCAQDDVIAALIARGLWKSRRRNSGADEYPARQKRASERRPDPMKSWRNASPVIRGTPVDHYLRSRGNALTDKEAASLQFSPALWHWPTQTKWPTMLARVSLASGEVLAVHQTFLKLDGSGKAPLGDKARLFAAGGRAAGGGVWFAEPDPSREFVIAEGIESTLSAMRIFGASAGCAALSEFGVRRLILPSAVRRVRIFADHDELGQGLSAAREAWRRWRAEGREVAVSIADQVGEDANDVLIRRMGRHG